MMPGTYLDKMRDYLRALNYNAGRGFNAKSYESNKEIILKMIDDLVVEWAESINNPPVAETERNVGFPIDVKRTRT